MCKETEFIQLIDVPGESTCRQWIGNGGAAYPIVGLPYLDKENIYTIFEIPEDKQESFRFIHQEDPGYLNFNDTDRSERRLELTGIGLELGSKLIKPLHTRKGIAFYNTKYMAPLADITYGREIYERETEGGQIYFAVKQGFLLRGIIMPDKAVDESLVETLEHIARESRFVFDREIAKERKDQMVINAETGEIEDE